MDKINNLNIKINALEEAISYPAIKNGNFSESCIIETNEFNYEIISEKIKNNEKLTNLEGTKMDLILEVLRLLNDNKIKFNVELHNTFGFYFRGLPLLILKITDGPTNNDFRMVYISVKVYKDTIKEDLNDIKVSKIVAGSLGSIFVLAVGMIGYSFIKGKIE
jgi:hypothetical protein